MQKIIFPMKNVRITQGIGGLFSHKGTFAIDLAGLDGGKDDAYAPFDGQIKKIYTNGNTVWLESLEPVLFADGTQDYCTIMMVHDDDVSDLYVGKIIRQGEVFFQEGKSGKTTGNHIHLEVAYGKFKGSGWFKNVYGIWMLINACKPHNAFFMLNNNIINDAGYEWKKTDKPYIEDFITYIVVKGDTLGKIAKKFNTKVTIIAKDNDIKNVNKISIGQRLKIRGIK